MPDERPTLTSRNATGAPPPAAPKAYPEVGLAGAGACLTLDELAQFVENCRTLGVPGDAQFKVRTKKMDRIRHITAAAPK